MGRLMQSSFRPRRLRRIAALPFLSPPEAVDLYCSWFKGCFV